MRAVMLIVTETTPTMISVARTAPITSWHRASAPYQLNAVAPIQGSFAYTPLKAICFRLDGIRFR